MHLFPFAYSSHFFFNEPATPQIYTLSLHDALPILSERFGEARVVFERRKHGARFYGAIPGRGGAARRWALGSRGDRKSTRLNSSHGYISYAVFCLKKKTRTSKLPGSIIFRGMSLSP